MKRFYVRGIAITTEGIFCFVDKDIKKINLKLKRIKINGEKYLLAYEKIIRKRNDKTSMDVFLKAKEDLTNEN